MRITKRIFQLLMSLLLITTLSFALVYEDGMTPQRWSTYTAQDGIISSEEESIRLVGDGIRTGYYLPIGVDYNNERFSWSLKYTHYFKTYIQVQTNSGIRYLTYYPLNEELGQEGRFIQYALGRGMRDGQWHTFGRNLQDDLEKYEPNNRVIRVLGFFIRGTGLVDNIRLDRVTSYGAIQMLMTDAIEGRNADVVYIVAGDSTRNNPFNQMINYYQSLLSLANIRVYNNAEPSLTGEAWKNNQFQATLNNALEATLGEGENTIFEFSFGINDYRGRADKARIKSELKEGLELYMSAKPRATVLLVVPVTTSIADRNSMLKEIYEELANELVLPLVDGVIPTQDIHGNPQFYEDETHPNAQGSRVIVDYILNEIADETIHNVIFP